MTRPRSFGLSALLVALPAAMLTLGSDAHATGMQSHIYIAELARDHLPAGELKSLLETHRTAFLSGAFFPDSGYAANDGYGEIAHWESFVEAYIQWIRKTYTAPYSDEAAEHIAFVIGAAAHGMGDQTYDILFHDKIGIVDGDLNEADMAADIFITNDLDRRENPAFVISTQHLADLFSNDLAHTVTTEVIDDGVKKAKFALSYTSEVLYTDYDKFSAQYPWAAAHYLSEGVPGAYPYDGEVISHYYEDIWRRLAGDEPMDAAIIGSNPLANGVDVPVDHTSMDSWITIFTGLGLRPETIDASSFFITNAKGNVVPCEIRTRGDAWASTLQLKPQRDWDFHATYQLHLTTSVRSLHDVPLASEYTLSFTTACAPGDRACDPPTPGTGGSSGAAAAQPSDGESGGCSLSLASTPNASTTLPTWIGIAFGTLSVLARRRLRRTRSTRNELLGGADHLRDLVGACWRARPASPSMIQSTDTTVRDLTTSMSVLPPTRDSAGGRRRTLDQGQAKHSAQSTFLPR